MNKNFTIKFLTQKGVLLVNEFSFKWRSFQVWMQNTSLPLQNIEIIFITRIDF